MLGNAVIEKWRALPLDGVTGSRLPPLSLQAPVATMARLRPVGPPFRLPALLAALLLLLAGGAAAQAVAYQEAVPSYESFTVRRQS